MTALTTLLCTHCEGAGLELHSGGQVICRYCGTVNVLDGVVCAHCEHTNPAGTETCTNCRQSLERACPQCGTLNWAGAETCSACGAALDRVALMGPRLVVDPTERFREQQRSSRSLKELEAESADRRSAEFTAMEARRQANLRAARRRQTAEQRVLLIGTAAVVIVIIVAVVVSVLLTGMR